MGNKKLCLIPFLMIFLVGCGTLAGPITTRETVSKEKVIMSYYADQLTEKELKAYNKLIENIEKMSTENLVLEESSSQQGLVYC